MILLFIAAPNGKKVAYALRKRTDAKQLLIVLDKYAVEWRIWDKDWTESSNTSAWKLFPSTDCGALFAGVYYPTK